MAFSQRTLGFTTVLLLLAVTGGGLWWWLRPAGEGAGQAEASAADSFGIAVPQASELAAGMATTVAGAEVVRGTLWITIHPRATARAFRSTVVRSQVEGLIEEVPVRENSVVSEGQPLLQIDSTELALDVGVARSELRRARADYDAVLLASDPSDPPEVRERREEQARARSGLDGAEVALGQAELQLERSTVRAPFEGRVADLLVVPGQYVSAGTDLMTVVDLDPIRVEAEVLEGGVDLLEEGRRATVTFDAFAEVPHEGRVRSINPVVTADGYARATILVPNPDGRIKPGMKAEVSLEAQSFEDQIMVPKEAVLEKDGGRTAVLVAREEEEGRQVARLRYVRTGRESDEMVAIVPSEDTEMVEPGEIVLVSGHQYLEDGASVRIAEDPVAATGPGG